MSINGWIGVDLDGTLAEYRSGDYATGKIGAPIKPMVERVKNWLANGIEVRIFTARAYTDGTPRRNLEVVYNVKAIEAWCVEQFGRKLPVTCIKDFDMLELWDDRAVRVAANLGQPCGYAEFSKA